MKGMAWLAAIALVAMPLALAGCNGQKEPEPQPGEQQESGGEKGLIEKAGEQTGSAWEATKEKTGEAVDATKEKTGEVWDATKEKTGETLKKTGEALENAGEKVAGDEPEK